MRNEEWLAEILGHRNFNGENWAIGDCIVFEDGSVAEIERRPGEEFCVWSEARAGQLTEVLQQIAETHVAGRPQASPRDWKQLFEAAGAFAVLRHA